MAERVLPQLTRDHIKRQQDLQNIKASMSSFYSVNAADYKSGDFYEQAVIWGTEKVISLAISPEESKTRIKDYDVFGHRFALAKVLELIEVGHNEGFTLTIRVTEGTNPYYSVEFGSSKGDVLRIPMNGPAEYFHRGERVENIISESVRSLEGANPDRVEILKATVTFAQEVLRTRKINKLLSAEDEQVVRDAERV